MKLRFAFLLAVFVLLPFAASAQTPVTESTANAYFASCTSQNDERLTPDAQASLCGCVSAKLMSSSTMEEIATMSEKPGPGRAAYDKMLINAYSTCLQIPIQDQITRECLTDSRIEQFGLGDKAALCECVGRKTGDFTAAQGSAVTSQILRKAPDTTDLYQAMLDNTLLREAAYDNVNKCLQSNNQ